MNNTLQYLSQGQIGYYSQMDRPVCLKIKRNFLCLMDVQSAALLLLNSKNSLPIKHSPLVHSDPPSASSSRFERPRDHNAHSNPAETKSIPLA